MHIAYLTPLTNISDPLKALGILATPVWGQDLLMALDPVFLDLVAMEV